MKDDAFQLAIKTLHSIYNATEDVLVELEDLAEENARLRAKVKKLKIDASRYKYIRRNTPPVALIEAGYPNLGDIPDYESIASYIDRMVDAAIVEDL